MSLFQQRLAAVYAALSGVGVDPRAITIVGVTKKQPVESVRQAVAAGLVDLGNNYVQEGEALRGALGNPPSVKWHFIGHLQSRKVKSLTDYGCVQSLDRIELVEELDRRMKAVGRTIDGLIEVNVGDEATKSGIALAELPAFLAAASAYSNVRVRGIMGLPPPLEPAEARRPFFRELREAFETHRDRYGLDTLSMGTSVDYLVAAQEGATMVRLGTTLFGERPR